MCLAARIACGLAGLLLAGVASAQPVQLDVTFRLTDLDYQPLANEPVRIAFGSDADWAAPGAGQRALTDAKGEARLRATVELGRRDINRDTTWLSLFAKSEQAEQLAVYVGLPYLGQEWVYGVELFHFADGDVMRQGFDVYLPDAEGRFTRRFAEDRGTHTIALDKGMVLQGAGHEPWEARLAPAEDGKPGHWQLVLAYKRHPPPVQR